MADRLRLDEELSADFQGARAETRERGAIIWVGKDNWSFTFPIDSLEFMVGTHRRQTDRDERRGIELPKKRHIPMALEALRAKIVEARREHRKAVRR